MATVDFTKIREDAIRACKGAITCGDDPTLQSVARTIGLPVVQLKSVFPTNAALHKATGYQRTYHFKYVGPS